MVCHDLHPPPPPHHHAQPFLPIVTAPPLPPLRLAAHKQHCGPPAAQLRIRLTQPSNADIPLPEGVDPPTEDTAELGEEVEPQHKEHEKWNDLGLNTLQ